MTAHFTYGDRRGAFSIDLGNEVVRLGGWTLASSAEVGQPDSSTIELDDVDGDLGSASDQILGLKTFVTTEDEAPADNQIIHWGYIGRRSYESADSLVTGESVRITMELQDLNAVAAFYVIPGEDADSGDRPAETVDERIAWLLASPYVIFVDTGLIESSSVAMDANNYANQTAADVLEDCCQAAAFNWYSRYDEAGNQVGLAFYDPNTSTLDTSDLRLSNVLASIDSNIVDGDGVTHTWRLDNARLEKDPSNVTSLAYLPYAKGTEHRSRSATADTYGRVDRVMADANVQTAAKAQARLAKFLRQAATENDVLTGSFQVLPANVNDLREGQRVSVETRQMPGYKSGFSWFRVLHRSVGQKDMTDEFYTIDVTLVPQEAPATIAIAQQITLESGPAFTFSSLTTPGNLLLAVVLWRELSTATQPPDDGETWTEIATCTFLRSVGGGDTNGCSIYAADATISQYVHHQQQAVGGLANGRPIRGVLYEITGATVADIHDAISLSLQGPGTHQDVGSLGVIAEGSMGFMLIGNGNDLGTEVFSGYGNWTRDLIACRDGETSSTDTFYCEAFPWGIFGHYTGDDTTVEAEVTVTPTPTVSLKWGGVACVVG